MRSSATCAWGSIWLAGSFAGIASRAFFAVSSRRRAAAIACSAAGISLAFLSAGVIAGSASRTARPRSAAARFFSASRTAALPSLRAGLSVIGVRLDVRGVVADGVDAVVGGGVLEVVLLPPPGLQPAQQRGRARTEVRCQDLQDDPAVLEQGDLPGFAVILELHGLVGPGDRAGPAVHGDDGQDRQHARDGQRGTPVGHPVHLLSRQCRKTAG